MCSSTPTSDRGPRCRIGASPTDLPEPHGDQDVVPRQRDGRPLAARAQHRDGVRPASPRRRRGPCGRSIAGLELVACGSSSAAHADLRRLGARSCSRTPTTTSTIISCHAYYEPEGGDYGSFLASAVDMDRFIESVVATADHVKAERRSDKPLAISLRRMERLVQVPLRAGRPHHRPSLWPVAPRLLEDTYSVVDAVVFGNLLISLIRHADRVKAASLAQLVNVIAPIMTEPGGPAWRQTTFYPFAIAARLARGVALELKLECPTYLTAAYGEVAVVDAVATYDEGTHSTAIFLVNRSQEGPVQVEIDTRALGLVEPGMATTLSDPDIHAANTLADPLRVSPADNATVTVDDGRLQITLPAVSWTALTLNPCTTRPPAGLQERN